MISEQEKIELRQLLLEAAKVLMEYWPGSGRTVGTDLGITEKSDGSIVTRADYASNEILVGGLKRLFPEDAIHSEELEPPPGLWDNKMVWIIDPLDGTSCFTTGSDEFCILVARTSAGRSDLGMMYFPARDVFVEAERGKGAQRNGVKLAVSSHTAARPQSVYTRLCELSDSELMYPSRLDSGNAFSMVAAGELDAAVFRLSKLREWDLAAPAVIIEEAGGKVSDERGQEVLFIPGKLPELFVVSNAKVHERVRTQIRK